MLSLVNYGTSDSEDNISDEENEIVAVTSQENGSSVKKFEIQDEKLQSIIKLPQPVNQSQQNQIEEDDDEFLHKKEVPEIAPPSKVKQKVKIMVPKLSDFKDDDDEKIDTGPKYPTASNRKTGLLNMLPKPSHGIITTNKISSVSSKPSQSRTVQNIKSDDTNGTASSSKQLETKKIGLIPYALMDHKKILDDKRAGKNKSQESDDSGEEEGCSFFSFNSKDEDLPKINDEEIKAMITKEANRMNERKKKIEESEEMQYEQQDYSQYYEQHQQEQQLNHEAMKALVGGTKAKRSKLDHIHIVDISDQDVLPDKDEWHRKNLAGETSFIPTGKIDEKGPSALAKRKHQISYLSMRAEKNMAELEAMWAANRQSNREGRSKYGF